MTLYVKVCLVTAELLDVKSTNINAENLQDKALITFTRRSLGVYNVPYILLPKGFHDYTMA